MTNWTDRPEASGEGPEKGNSTIENDLGGARDRLRREADEATRIAGEGAAAFKRKAAHLAEGAKAELESHGEDAKSRTAQGLDAFARAMRTAHDDLARDHPGILSDLVGEAASSLEQASGGLRRTSAGDIIEAARDFGRRNPVGFIAASMLAGFAAARFAGSSAPRPRQNTGPGRRSLDRSDGGGVAAAAEGRSRANYGQSATTRGAL